MLTTKINGMIRLFRPELPLAAGVCTLIGQVLAAGGLPGARAALLGFACVFCLSAAALIFNDYFDYEVDKVNAPGRPLPSGAVSAADVLGLGVVTTLIGLGCAYALGLPALLVGVALWLVGFLYNWRYKQTGLPGNLMVSTSVGATFIFGAVTVGAPWSGIAWVFGLVAFFFDLGEEIAGDAMDMEGDKRRGSRSIALLRGRRFAVRLAAALWGVVIALTLLPALLGWLGTAYLAAILVIDAVLVYFAMRLLQSQDPESGRRAMRGAYLSATVCLIAFLIARLIG